MYYIYDTSCGPISLAKARVSPRPGAASIDRSDQTALQGTAPQPNKSRLQADSERLYVADGRSRETTRAHDRRASRACSLTAVGLPVSTSPDRQSGGGRYT